MMEYHGRRLRLRLEGESHSPEMRVTIWGLPVGEPVDKETLLGLLARRRPGQSPLMTGRNEKDEPEFLSGARDGMLTGEPVVIRFGRHGMPTAWGKRSSGTVTRPRKTFAIPSQAPTCWHRFLSNGCGCAITRRTSSSRPRLTRPKN